MSSDTLIIQNVNLDLLEEQRQTLNQFLFKTDRLKNYMTEAEWNALIGIGNMLDAWSDGEYYKKEECNNAPMPF